MKALFEEVYLSKKDPCSAFLERGLVVESSDPKRLQNVLFAIGATRLILFSLPYMDENNRYVEGTTLERIMDDYEANEYIWRYTWLAVECIEIAFRSALENVLGEKYGRFPYDKSFYEESEDHTWSELESFIKRVASKVKGTIVKRYPNKVFPICVIIDKLNFRKVVYFYQMLKKDMKEKIASKFGLCASVFSSWIEDVYILWEICNRSGRFIGKEIGTDPVTPDSLMYSRYMPLFEKATRGTYFPNMLILSYMLEGLGNEKKRVRYLEGILETIEEFSFDKALLGFPDDLKPSDVASTLLEKE